MIKTMMRSVVISMYVSREYLLISVALAARRVAHGGTPTHINVQHQG